MEPTTTLDERRRVASLRGLRRYTAVLGAPGVLPFVLASAVGRLPLGMTPLAIVLISRSSGVSYGRAGVYLGAYTFGAALAAPIVGRAVDRLGEARLLGPLAVAFPLALGGVAAAIRDGAPPGVVAAVALLAGASLPPLGACMRALWPQLLVLELRDTAYAFEATVQEFAFIAGPLLAAAIAAASPTIALLAAAGSGCAGALAFAVLAARRRVAPSGHAEVRRRALTAPGVRTVVLASVAVGAAFGAVEVAMPAFAEHHGGRSGAGICLAAFALGSMIGGAWIGARPPRATPRRRYLMALAALAAGLAPPLLAGSVPVMAALMLLAGTPIAPGFAAAYVLLDDLGAAGATTETFAWISTAIVAGVAVGNALGGAVIQGHGSRGSLVLAVACAASALLLALARRRSLAAG